MKSIINYLSVFIVLLSGMSGTSSAQAIDFAQYDCDGDYHSLFQELDSGKVVVMEFVMDCQLCVDGAIALQSMLSQFNQQYPGVIRVYQFAYSTLMDCNTMKAFRDSGNFQSEVFEENSHLMAHYGGFGMPTIGVAAGPNHLDIYSSVGFMTSDTAQLGNALRNYFASVSVEEQEDDPFVYAYFNPSLSELNVETYSNDETLFELFNSSGIRIISTLMKTDIGEKTSIDLTGISRGLYFANFTTAKRTAVVKIAVAY